jgi:hypothetical protein
MGKSGKRQKRAGTGEEIPAPDRWYGGHVSSSSHRHHLLVYIVETDLDWRDKFEFVVERGWRVCFLKRGSFLVNRVINEALNARIFLNSFYFLNSLWRNLERFISLFGLIL